MHTRKASLLAVAAVAAALSGGCSSMERAYDDLTDRDRDRDRDRNQQRVELNNAGRRRLAELPGISDDEAASIIAHRPYANRRDLVRKNVLSQDEFERIRDYVYVDQEKD